MSDNEGKSFSVVNLGSLTKPVDTATQGVIDGAGAFLSKICLPAAEEFGLLLRDRISYWRASNLAKVLKKTESKLIGDLRGISPKLIFPIIENASLEEDSELQDLWANLLASAVDPNFTGKIRGAYIDIIKQLEVIDVHILNIIYQSYRQWREQRITEDGGEKGFHYSPVEHSIGKYEIIESLQILLATYENAIDNLIRVRCITSFVEMKDIEMEVWDYNRIEEITVDKRYEYVCMTTLGVDFVEACINPKTVLASNP